MRISLETDVYVFSNWVEDPPDGARLELDRKFIQRILKLAEAVETLEINRAVVSDYTPEFLYDGKTEDEIDLPMRSECTALPMRSECTALNITKTEIYWRGAVKHSEPTIYWETEIIHITLLQEIESIWNTPDTDLPLLINKLNHIEAQNLLHERLKEC